MRSITNSVQRKTLFTLFLDANSVSVPNIELHSVCAVRILNELLVQLLDEHGVGIRLGGVENGAAPKGVVKGNGAPWPEELQNPLVVVPVIGL